jgi:hypothetical protein
VPAAQPFIIITVDIFPRVVAIASKCAVRSNRPCRGGFAMFFPVFFRSEVSLFCFGLCLYKASSVNEISDTR